MKDVLFLLSKEETELFSEEQLSFDTYWWLRSGFPDYSDSVWGVDADGSLDNFGIDYSCGGVCPAFKSDEILNSSNLPEILKLGKFCGIQMEWTLSKDKSLYLLSNYIVSSVFDFKSNDYQKSHVRKIVKAMEKKLLKALKKENARQAVIRAKEIIDKQQDKNEIEKLKGGD